MTLMQKKTTNNKNNKSAQWIKITILRGVISK